jgi:hypothetical protein
MGIICSSDTIHNSKQGSRTISSRNTNQKSNIASDDTDELEKRMEDMKDSIMNGARIMNKNLKEDTKKQLKKLS